MTTEKTNTQQLFSSLDETWNEFFILVCCADENNINQIPFEDSWTVAQLATHVKKSNKAIWQGLQMKGAPANRSSDEREEELRNTFLDFTIKFNSPDFIVPEKKEYQKRAVVEQLENSIEQLKQLRQTTNLSEIISLPVFGEITKLELLYFVLYHTQRHLHQLKNILRILSQKN
jgi:hypothetical protein